MPIADLASARAWALRFHKRIIILGIVFATAIGNYYVKTGASFANGFRRALFDNLLLETTDPGKRLLIGVVGYGLSGMVQIGMMPILFLIIFLLFKWRSSRLIKKNRLVRFPTKNNPAVSEVVSLIWKASGLPANRLPCLYWQPFSKDVNAFMFGGPRNYAIALTAGLLLNCVRGDGRKARAILSHELGHIHNRDVTYFYLMQAFMLLFALSFMMIDVPAGIVWFFAPDVLINNPLRTSFAVQQGLDAFGVRLSALFEILEVLVIFGVLALAMRYTIRGREYYADSWAVSRGISVTDLEQALAKRGPSPLGSFRLLDRIQRTLKFHPETRSRVRMLKQPLELIKPTLSYGFVVGFLGALQIGRLDKFGLPQVVGLAGILCALWGLVLDAQAIGITYLVSPGRKALAKALWRLIIHGTVFALAFALGLLSEGTTEFFLMQGFPNIVVRHGLGIATLTFSVIFLAVVVGITILLFIVFSYTGLVTFAAMLIFRKRCETTRMSNGFAFDWGISALGVICCGLSLPVVLIAVIYIVRLLTQAEALPLGVLCCSAPIGLWSFGTFLVSLIRLSIEFSVPLPHPLALSSDAMEQRTLQV